MGGDYDELLDLAIKRVWAFRNRLNGHPRHKLGSQLIDECAVELKDHPWGLSHTVGRVGNATVIVVDHCEFDGTPIGILFQLTGELDVFFVSYT